MRLVFAFLFCTGLWNFSDCESQVDSVVRHIQDIQETTVTVLLNENQETAEFGYIGIIEHILHDSIKPVAAFKSIPYALPPVGTLRYKVSTGYLTGHTTHDTSI